MKKTAIVVLSFMLMTFVQLAVADSASMNIEDKALAYIKTVLPLDFSHYNITWRSHKLAEYPNGTYRTDSVTFSLNSTDSTESYLAVNCLFRNGVQYTCDMRVMKGSPIYSKPCLNLVEVTRDIIEKHQAQTGIDSTELLSMLDKVKSSEHFSMVTQDNITLTVSQGHVPTGLKMINGSLHVDGTKIIIVTSFDWDYTMNGAAHRCFSISFDDGIFHGLRDARILYRIVDNKEATDPQLETASFSFAVLAAVLPSGAVVGVSLLIYFKKRKSPEKEAQELNSCGS